MLSVSNQLCSLKGRCAIITGANGSLGKVISHALAECGVDLILVDRPGTDFSVQASELEKLGVDVRSEICDLEDELSRSLLIERVLQRGEGLSIVVNNAAFVGTTNISGWAVPYEEQSLEAWRRAFEVNLTSVFDFCRGITPILKSSPGASIINVSSIYGMLGPDWSLYDGTNMSNPAAYAASKGGLIQLTRWLATTLAPNIRVNTISPGGIWRDQPKDFVERYESRTPLKRMAREDDFAGPVVFLASDLSRYITGHNLVVDGGWSSW